MTYQDFISIAKLCSLVKIMTLFTYQRATVNKKAIALMKDLPDVWVSCRQLTWILGQYNRMMISTTKTTIYI